MLASRSHLMQCICANRSGAGSVCSDFRGEENRGGAVTEVGCGTRHSCILHEGVCFTAGSNSCGQLGIGKKGFVLGGLTMLDPDSCFHGMRVTNFAGGTNSSLFVLADQT
jgi:hypothetical protein